MSEIEDGGPVYPCAVEKIDGPQRTVERFSGMSLRDWFAGKAMQGFCSLQFRQNSPEISNPGYWAKASYQMADAMLKAREKKV